MTTTLMSFVFWYFLMRREIGLELSEIGKHTLAVYKTLYGKAMSLLRRGKAVS